MKPIVWLVVVAAAAPAFAKPGATEKKMADSYREYRLKEGHFKCALPGAWDIRRDGDAAEKTYGVTAVGPQDDGISATLRASFFAAGNAHFPDAAAYLSRQTDEEDRALSGDPAPKVEKTTFMKAPATRLTRETFEYVPPKSTASKKIAVKVETLVLPSKDGFYVLELSAAAKGFARRRTAYRRMLDGFAVEP